MCINTSKTKVLLIYFRCNQGHAVPYITRDGSVTECSNNAKIIGVTFSSDLTWNVHFDNIMNIMLYQLKKRQALIWVTYFVHMYQ